MADAAATLESNMTLEELKAANAEAEKAKAEAAQTGENELDDIELDGSPQDSDDDNDDGSGAEELDEVDEGAEPKSKDPDEDELEDWMKRDADTPEADKKFTDKDMGAQRHKYTSKLLDQKTELDDIKAELEALKNKLKADEPQQLVRPKRDDFFDNDDPDGDYEDALTEFILKKSEAQANSRAAATNQQQAQQQASAKISAGEDAHYDRVAKLVASTSITAENYQAADRSFREAIDVVIPGSGDNIAAVFMGKLGEDSDKVIYSIGINSAKKAKFTQLLRDDPTGLEAGMYLAEIKSSVSPPKKQPSRAPKPAPESKGDAKEGGQYKSFKKAYKAASNDQEKMDIIGRAKASGIGIKETLSW